METINIRPDDPASPAAQRLIAELDAYLATLYPAESNHLLPIAALRQANVTFLTAWVNGIIAGCGAFVDYGEYAELKRMYVRPEFRGRQIGRKILAELEARIRAAKISLVRLETGIHQSAALALYEQSGYVRRGPFGDYREDPLSVFMEKSLFGTIAGEP